MFYKHLAEFIVSCSNNSGVANLFSSKIVCVTVLSRCDNEDCRWPLERGPLYGGIIRNPLCRICLFSYFITIAQFVCSFEVYLSRDIDLRIRLLQKSNIDQWLCVFHNIFSVYVDVVDFDIALCTANFRAGSLQLW